MTIFVKNKHTLQIDVFKFRCCIGKKGSTVNKKEGDKKTPKGIYEIESDMVAEISTIILDTTSQNLSSVEGRKLITDKIMMGLNEYLAEEGFNPDIHYVYIINYNII